MHGNGEVVAALHMTLRMPKDVPLHLISNSPLLCDIIFKNSPKWEDSGWLRVADAPYIHALLCQLRQ